MLIKFCVQGDTIVANSHLFDHYERAREVIWIALTIREVYLLLVRSRSWVVVQLNQDSEVLHNIKTFRPRGQVESHIVCCACRQILVQGHLSIGKGLAKIVIEGIASRPTLVIAIAVDVTDKVCRTIIIDFMFTSKRRHEEVLQKESIISVYCGVFARINYC